MIWRKQKLIFPKQSRSLLIGYWNTIMPTLPFNCHLHPTAFKLHYEMESCHLPIQHILIVLRLMAILVLEVYTLQHSHWDGNPLISYRVLDSKFTPAVCGLAMSSLFTFKKAFLRLYVIGSVGASCRPFETAGSSYSCCISPPLTSL